RAAEPAASAMSATSARVATTETAVAGDDLTESKTYLLVSLTLAAVPLITKELACVYTSITLFLYPVFR
ncbi:MAG: hypothetical protein M3417_02925, partial [Actinomycetota bacterium]|nr:hypothetical protein [Actinomycetota bacterium]